MSTPYVGEIRLFAGNFAPQGWLPCDGSLVPIADYDTLFQLIGTTYGGDGQTTFALPDLRGRVGVEAVTLTAQQLPAHTHPVVASSQPATHSAAAGNFFAQGEDPLYAAPGGATVTLGPTTTFGGGQPHDNLQPYLGLNFIISLFGIFPSP
jgi:microcystin-dependent protein